MPKFILDGKEIEFNHGQTIIEAAKEKGITIPHFCWHPSLSISGNCRVCLVEIEKVPKLAIACSTIASEGMVVHSASPKALAARNAVMEFILINHPLDCPICDEAGECKLQDYAYQHGVGESRFVEEKVHKDKRVELGPHVMFDGDRCISCSRCIRFCDEVAGENQLTFVKRGDRVTIVTFPGKQLDNPYSLNVTDICPVGALTNRDFRFRARVWDMSATKTICTGCARGCNIDMWVRSGEILRLTPRFNADVNSYWMCDHGRLNTFNHINANDRVNGPHLRRDGELKKVDWDEAFAVALSDLKNLNEDEIAFVGSPFATCEDNYVFQKFAKTIFNSKNIFITDKFVAGSGDEILIREDITPNQLGAELVGFKKSDGDLTKLKNLIKSHKIKALYILEDDLIALDPEFESLIPNLNLIISHATNFNQTSKYSEIVFPAATYAEKNGTWVNFQGMVQRIRPAVTTLEIDRSLDGLAVSRLDKFGTDFDRWGKVNKRDARASFKIINGLANLFGQKWKYQTAEDVFNDIVKNISPFNNLNYESIGESGVLLSLVKEKISVKG